MSVDRRVLHTISRDVFRINGKAGWSEFAKQLAVNRAYRAVFSYRLCRFFRCRPFVGSILLYPFFLLAHRFFSGSICCELPVSTKIGAGFVLQHGYATVFNKQVVIGNDVTVFHHVTVGATARGVPRIGDRVVITANAMVLGPVVIGDESTIGAGSVVLHDVAANSIVAGNPAKSIRHGAPARAKHVAQAL